MKKFCIAGPVDPERHYFIPKRLKQSELDTLIADREYFVLHAPRQSGKTTGIEEYVDYLNSQGLYTALYINIEPAQAARDNVEKALISILSEIKTSLHNQLEGEERTIQHIEQILSQPQIISYTSFVECLEFWAESSPKPRVLFIDEIDSLIGDSLLSVLRQIRRGFSKRPEHFPQSICLIGLRDVRDYRVWSKESGVYVSASSPFNIKARSLLLPNFSQEEVRQLLAQHTKETGQIFESDAVEHLFYLTQGQPWLVNALAYEAAFVEVVDRTQPITKAVIDRVKEVLIKRRDTHLDSLIDKLREPRVRPIIDALINGQTDVIDFDTDSVQYVKDLGLLKPNCMEIANPIYKEIIPRELTAVSSMSLSERFVNRPAYIHGDGSLNVEALLDSFTEFYQENSSIWLEKFDYKESGPHLLLMAFLQRIINGGGTILREFALGRGRVDILIQWKRQRIVIELKVKRREKTLAEGLEQTAKYMDDAKATEGHLLIFDRDTKKSWEDKISHELVSFNSSRIHVWTM